MTGGPTMCRTGIVTVHGNSPPSPSVQSCRNDGLQQSPPERSRYLVIARAFDDAAVARLGEDSVVAGLHLVAPGASEPLKIDLTDPNGTVVGAVAWSPGSPRQPRQGRGQPGRFEAMLVLVGLTIAFLIVFAYRGWKEVQKREFRLQAALNNMAHGLCMFDADLRTLSPSTGVTPRSLIPTPEAIAPGMTAVGVDEATPGSLKIPDRKTEATLATRHAMIADHGGRRHGPQPDRRPHYRGHLSPDERRRFRRDLRGRHRADSIRGADQVSGASRCVDRAAEPRRLLRGDRGRLSPICAVRNRWRCSASTSTTSRMSMTRSVIRLAISC